MVRLSTNPSAFFIDDSAAGLSSRRLLPPQRLGHVGRHSYYSRADPDSNTLVCLQKDGETDRKPSVKTDFRAKNFTTDKAYISPPIRVSVCSCLLAICAWLFPSAARRLANLQIRGIVSPFVRPRQSGRGLVTKSAVEDCLSTSEPSTLRSLGERGCRTFRSGLPPLPDVSERS